MISTSVSAVGGGANYTKLTNPSLTLIFLVPIFSDSQIMQNRVCLRGKFALTTGFVWGYSPNGAGVYCYVDYYTCLGIGIVYMAYGVGLVVEAVINRF